MKQWSTSWRASLSGASEPEENCATGAASAMEAKTAERVIDRSFIVVMYDLSGVCQNKRYLIREGIFGDIYYANLNSKSSNALTFGGVMMTAVFCGGGHWQLPNSSGAHFDANRLRDCIWCPLVKLVSL